MQRWCLIRLMRTAYQITANTPNGFQNLSLLPGYTAH